MSKKIVTLAILLAMADSVIYGQEGAKQSRENKAASSANLDLAKQKVVDLRQHIKEMKLKEGLNLVHIFDIGARLWAEVKNGEIVGYVATNNEGNILPLTIFKGRVKMDSQKQTRSKFEQAAKQRQEREEAWRRLIESMPDPETKGCFFVMETFDSEGNYIGFSSGYGACPKGI